MDIHDHRPQVVKDGSGRGLRSEMRLAILQYYDQYTFGEHFALRCSPNSLPVLQSHPVRDAHDMQVPSKTVFENGNIDLS